MCVKEKYVLLLQMYFLWSKLVVPKKSTANDHAKFIPFWHSVSTKPTVLGYAKQPMRIQLWTNAIMSDRLQKYENIA